MIAKAAANGEYQPGQLQAVEVLDWMVFEMKVRNNEIEIKCQIKLDTEDNWMWDVYGDKFIGKFIR